MSGVLGWRELLAGVGAGGGRGEGRTGRGRVTQRCCCRRCGTESPHRHTPCLAASFRTCPRTSRCHVCGHGKACTGVGRAIGSEDGGSPLPPCPGSGALLLPGPCSGPAPYLPCPNPQGCGMRPARGDGPGGNAHLDSLPVASSYNLLSVPHPGSPTWDSP